MQVRVMLYEGKRVSLKDFIGAEVCEFVLELPSVPRIGEKLWMRAKDSDHNGIICEVTTVDWMFDELELDSE